jgi:hypothetical protein
MTEKNIKAAFREAGLVPLDPESVISKLDVRLRTPTPVVEEDGLSSPQGSNPRHYTSTSGVFRITR